MPAFGLVAVAGFQLAGERIGVIGVGQMDADAVDDEGAAEQGLRLAQQHVAAGGAELAVALFDEAGDAQRFGIARRRGGADDIAHAKAKAARHFLADDEPALDLFEVIEVTGAQLVGDGADLRFDGGFDADDAERFIPAAHAQRDRARNAGRADGPRHRVDLGQQLLPVFYAAHFVALFIAVELHRACLVGGDAGLRGGAA